MVPRAKITVTGLHSESSLRVSEKSSWRLLKGEGERLERAALNAPICSNPWGLAFEIGEARAEERKRESRMMDCILSRYGKLMSRQTGQDILLIEGRGRQLGQDRRD